MAVPYLISGCHSSSNPIVFLLHTERAGAVLCFLRLIFAKFRPYLSYFMHPDKSTKIPEPTHADKCAQNLRIFTVGPYRTFVALIPFGNFNSRGISLYKGRPELDGK